METRNHNRSAEHGPCGPQCKVKSERAPGLHNPQGVDDFPSLPAIDKCLRAIAAFLPTGELDALTAICCTSICRAEYRRAIVAMAERIANMPQTYDTDGQGLDAIAHLHYVCGDWHWYITEKDRTGLGTQQAFGLVVGHERELGYISIAEIVITAGADLDLFWTPKPLCEIPE